MSDCVFCSVIAGDVPAAVVFDDDTAMGFLDTRPVFKGHVLVVPKDHVVTLTDIPEALVGPFFLRVRTLARAVQDGLGAKGTFVAMNNTISQSVAHLHVHVVPRNPKDGLRGFFWPRTKYAGDDELTAYANRIKSAL